MLWPPERATRSWRFKPCDWKLERSTEKFENGEGRLAFASLKLAVLASLLPNCTG